MPTTDGEETKYQVRALSRGIAVLDAISRDVGSDLAAIAAETGLPKSTVIRILAVLEEENLVARDPATGVARLAHRIAEWSSAYWGDLDVTRLLKPTLTELARRTGQTANIGLLDGTSVLHLCVVEADRPLQFRSADLSRDDAYCTGLGKALLARKSPTDLKERFRGVQLARRTPNTRVTLEAITADTRVVTDRGYAFDDEEGDLGVRCVAINFSPAPGCDAALSISGPASELDSASHAGYVSVLRSVASEISADPELRRAIAHTASSLRS